MNPEAVWSLLKLSWYLPGENETPTIRTTEILRSKTDTSYSWTIWQELFLRFQFPVTPH